MRDGDTNLLVLTLYVIGITYTFNQMVDSIDDQIKLEFNKAKVDEQLKEQELQDKIGVSFSLKPMYSIKDPKDLSINIENKSEDIIRRLGQLYFYGIRWSFTARDAGNSSGQTSYNP
jgi:hypothetical protein